MKTVKVLITHPDFKDPGGVANYYRKLKHHFSLPVKHFIIGSRPGEKGFFRGYFRLVTDFFSFFFSMVNYKPDIVHVNPSLDIKSFLRDSIFILIAKMFKKRTVVFYRGLHPSFQNEVTKNKMWLFKYVFKKTDASIVLSNDFYNTLNLWGYTNPVYTEVTVVDDKVLTGITINELFENRIKKKKCTILFLSRVLKEKGIYETVDAFRIVQKDFLNVELIIAGDGIELENVKNYVRKNNIKNIKFTGYVKGDKKTALLENADIFCFPSYSEGMPNSVIEAMAFGLPVITRHVGGLVDFFENGKHGFITKSKNPGDFAEFIKKLYLDKNLYKEISITNYTKAQKKFLGSGAAKRLEMIYKEIVKN